jgi:hypothetical protein
MANYPYKTVNDLPVPLRATIVELALQVEMPLDEIAARFSIPVQWVQLLIETPPGSTKH